jgi:hypothetical protein
MADVRKRLLRPAPKGCGPNRAKPGILRMFTQFRRMTETPADHALNSRGYLTRITTAATPFGVASRPYGYPICRLISDY